MALLPSNPIPERSQSTPKESLFILVGNIAIAKRSEGIAFYSSGKSKIAIAKRSEGIAFYSSGKSKTAIAKRSEGIAFYSNEKYCDSEALRRNRSLILMGNIAIASEESLFYSSGKYNRSLIIVENKMLYY